MDQTEHGRVTLTLASHELTRRTPSESVKRRGVGVSRHLILTPISSFDAVRGSVQCFRTLYRALKLCNFGRISRQKGT